MCCWPWGRSLTWTRPALPESSSIVSLVQVHGPFRPQEAPFIPMPQNGQDTSKRLNLICLSQSLTHRSSSTWISLANTRNLRHCVACFLNSSCLFSQYISSMKQGHLNGSQEARALERLRWEVWPAVKMARFHHFLHSNYHTLSASALPLLIACFTTSHTHRTMRDAAGKWLTLQPSPAASESS